ncbi:MAG: YncE family protein, partial [Bryobacteraceae bacterium]
MTITASAFIGLLTVTFYLAKESRADVEFRFAGPTSSQPMSLSADGTLLAVANPDNDSVSFFDVQSDSNRKLAEVSVETEPNSVALNPEGTRAYVANTVSGTVTVIAITRGSANFARVLTNIKVGTEPYGVALTPNGNKLYVTNARSNSVSVIDTNTYQNYRTIENAGPEPRGIAITNNLNDNDDDETVFVTQFLALPLAGKPDGEDDSKAGVVTVLSTATDSIERTIVLSPMADSGFKAAGDAFARVAPPATPVEADFKFVTGAYPNQLNSVGIRGNFAFFPSTGSSPNGPVRFNVNTQSLLSVVDIARNVDAGRTINMHTAVRDQTNARKTFITVPWSIAFKNSKDEAYVVSAASNLVVKLAVDQA